jgi:hypothetical protein
VTTLFGMRLSSEWNNNDRSNLAAFILSETGQKLMFLAAATKRPLAPKFGSPHAPTTEQLNAQSQRYFGFMEFPDWMVNLTMTQPDKVQEPSWFQEAESEIPSITKKGKLDRTGTPNPD